MRILTKILDTIIYIHVYSAGIYAQKKIYTYKEIIIIIINEVYILYYTTKKEEEEKYENNYVINLHFLSFSRF
jgi:hypothetical protein